MKKIVFGIILAVFSVGMLTLASSLHSVKASGTIYIRADGSIDPPTAPIQLVGGVYTFIGNISETIEIQRNDIVIDGNRYTLQHFGESYGFYLNDRSGVIIKNTNIMGFDNGIDIIRSRDCMIIGNNIANNYNGIHIHFFCHGITVRDNNITNNDNFGIMIYGDSTDNVIYHNNFIDNYQHASAQFALSGTWDNGVEGNYWDDYIGADTNGDGIGDAPYMIETGSQDRYPLMTMIPEFPSAIILLLAMVFTTIAVIIAKKDSLRQHSS